CLVPGIASQPEDDDGYMSRPKRLGRSLVPAGAFVDAGGEQFAVVSMAGQDEAAVAIAAVGRAVGPQLDIDARMAKRAADAVAGDAVRMDDHHLGRAGGVGGHAL